MNGILGLIGRDRELFEEDIQSNGDALSACVRESSFLVIGGAGSIGQAVVKELFCREPRVLHVVDISENSLVELVRDIRSSLGYIEGDFQTFTLDCGAVEFEVMMSVMGHYDYILNLSALKHVRSERDPFTLMRMIDVNILNTEKTLRMARAIGSRKYFCVSTDKAANPVNMMGASKRIMELFLMRASAEIPVSTARFANVAFSDGSLLHGFNQRLMKQQPLSAPIARFAFGSLPYRELRLKKHREFLAQVLDHAIRTHGAHILFLPHTIGPTPDLDDRLIARAIASEMRESADSVRILETEYGARELKGLIRRGAFIIGERIHSLIGATGVSTPYLCFGVREDTRVKGIITDMCEMGEAVHYINGTTAEDATAQLDRLWEGREATRNKLTQLSERFKATLDRAGTVIRKSIEAAAKHA